MRALTGDFSLEDYRPRNQRGQRICQPGKLLLQGVGEIPVQFPKHLLAVAEDRHVVNFQTLIPGVAPVGINFGGQADDDEQKQKRNHRPELAAR